MDFADENLRESRAQAGAIPHFLAKRRVSGDIVLGERGFFARQQRFGGTAITAARTGVDFDSSGHVALYFGELPNYMGALWVSTTRANTSTSTEAALARKSARAQASTVAPEVRTSSIRITRRPAISDCLRVETLNAPCTLLARCGFDRPICCWVGRIRRSASGATLIPVCRSMMRASAPD